MMNKEKQIGEYEDILLYFCFNEKDNKELKSNDVKEKYNFGFRDIYFAETISVFLHITFRTFVP